MLFLADGNNSRFLDPKIENFFQTFSKTILYFSTLKVTKEVIDRDFEKCRNQVIFMMHCKHTVTKVQCRQKRVLKL